MAFIRDAISLHYIIYMVLALTLDLDSLEDNENPRKGLCCKLLDVFIISRFMSASDFFVSYIVFNGIPYKSQALYLELGF